MGLPPWPTVPIRIILTTKMVCSKSRRNPNFLTTESTEDTEKEKSPARIMHAWSAAGPLSSVLTAFPTLGLLGRVDDYACAALGRKALSARRYRPFASTTRELCGLARFQAGIPSKLSRTTGLSDVSLFNPQKNSVCSVSSVV